MREDRELTNKVSKLKCFTNEFHSLNIEMVMTKVTAPIFERRIQGNIFMRVVYMIHNNSQSSSESSHPRTCLFI